MTVLWLVGGVDPTGGAGLARDRVTATQCDPRVQTVEIVTAHTQQGDGAPARATAVEPEILRQAFRAALPPHAAKIGLVPAGLVPSVAVALARVGVPVVVDPVLRASDGGDLGGRADALAPLLSHAMVITPNRPEAAALTGVPADDPGLARALALRFPGLWILLKDGHGTGPRVVDRLVRDDTETLFDRKRSSGADVRGTGCALGTAIACGLARGLPVPRAVGAAIAWLDAARARATPGPDGRPHLPATGPAPRW